MDNKGFTLVEVVVAVVISTFAAASVYLILNMSFTQYKLSRSESQIEIEAQEMTEKLKPLLTCCERVEQPTIAGETGKYTRIKTKNSDGSTIYSTLVLDDNKVYLITSFNEVDYSSLTWGTSNYMAQYVKSIKLNPDNFDFMTDTSFDTVECHIDLETGGVEYTTSFIVRVRGN